MTTHIRDAAIASPPHASDNPDAVRGPWVALLTGQYGWPCDLDEFGDETPEIAVVRGTAAPKADNEQRRPGSYRAEDVLYEVTEFSSDEDLAARWAQARMVAALLNHNQAKLDALDEMRAGR